MPSTQPKNSGPGSNRSRSPNANNGPKNSPRGLSQRRGVTVSKLSPRSNNSPRGGPGGATSIRSNSPRGGGPGGGAGQQHRLQSMRSQDRTGVPGGGRIGESTRKVPGQQHDNNDHHHQRHQHHQHQHQRLQSLSPGSSSPKHKTGEHGHIQKQGSRKEGGHHAVSGSPKRKKDTNSTDDTIVPGSSHSQARAKVKAGAKTKAKSSSSGTGTKTVTRKRTSENNQDQDQLNSNDQQQDQVPVQLDEAHLEATVNNLVSARLEDARSKVEISPQRQFRVVQAVKQGQAATGASNLFVPLAPTDPSMFQPARNLHFGSPNNRNLMTNTSGIWSHDIGSQTQQTSGLQTGFSTITANNLRSVAQSNPSPAGTNLNHYANSFNPPNRTQTQTQFQFGPQQSKQYQYPQSLLQNSSTLPPNASNKLAFEFKTKGQYQTATDLIHAAGGGLYGFENGGMIERDSSVQQQAQQGNGLAQAAAPKQSVASRMDQVLAEGLLRGTMKSIGSSLSSKNNSNSCVTTNLNNSYTPIPSFGQSDSSDRNMGASTGSTSADRLHRENVEEENRQKEAQREYVMNKMKEWDPELSDSAIDRMYDEVLRGEGEGNKNLLQLTSQSDLNGSGSSDGTVNGIGSSNTKNTPDERFLDVQVARLRNRLEIATTQVKLTSMMNQSKSCGNQSSQSQLQQTMDVRPKLSMYYMNQKEKYEHDAARIRDEIKNYDPLPNLPSPRGCFEVREKTEFYESAKKILAFLMSKFGREWGEQLSCRYDILGKENLTHKELQLLQYLERQEYINNFHKPQWSEKDFEEYIKNDAAIKSHSSNSSFADIHQNTRYDPKIFPTRQDNRNFHEYFTEEDWDVFEREYKYYDMIFGGRAILHPKAYAKERARELMKSAREKKLSYANFIDMICEIKNNLEALESQSQNGNDSNDQNNLNNDNKGAFKKEYHPSSVAHGRTRDEDGRIHEWPAHDMEFRRITDDQILENKLQILNNRVQGMLSSKNPSKKHIPTADSVSGLMHLNRKNVGEHFFGGISTRHKGVLKKMAERARERAKEKRIKEYEKGVRSAYENSFSLWAHSNPLFLSGFRITPHKPKWT